MESLDQIWRDYHEGLLGFIRRRVGAADLAEDILQDVFVKAHSRLDTLVNADRIQSWLYQIARNTIIDYHRTRKSAEPLPDEVAQQSEHNNEEEWQELGKCVLPMIKMLPEGYREAVLLSEIDGLPLKEVAKRMNLSLPGAKSRVQRGREKLKTRMVDEKTLRGRYHRESWRAGENYQKVQFEDEQIRVTRLVCAPGKRFDVPAGASGPALLIALSPARLSVIEHKGKAPKLNLGLGQTGWQPAGKQARLESPGGAPAELLRFEFKTGPVDVQDGKPKAHDHTHE